MKFFFPLLCFLFAFYLAPRAALALDTGAVMAGQAETGEGILAETIRRGSAQNIPYRDTAVLKEFYKSRQYEKIWISREKPNKKARAALKVLEESWTHGLSPAAYNTELLDTMADSRLDPRQQAEFEVLLSEAVAAYAHDVTGMRVSPRDAGEDGQFWNRGISYRQGLDFIAEEENIEDALARLLPDGPLYQALRQEYIRLVKDVVEEPDADPVPLTVTRTLRPGDTSPAVVSLRHRLGHRVSGGQRDQFYDEDLAMAVARFQKAHGLRPDALVGRRTYAALNQGRHDKLASLIANMERQRWLDPRFPARYIVVNIPAMTLWGIEDGHISFEMPVIVGREKRPTMSFIANITGIRFNPSWNVPDTIKTEDFLPALQKDPDALKKKGIELIRYTSDGVEPIDSAGIDWAAMTVSDVKALGMVQNPGDNNALGRIRVLMPNKYDIYLHDTNSPDLFRKDFRALSSGCVRVSEPRKLAHFILSGNRGWEEERIDSYLAKGKTAEVKTESTLPVYILYQTIWLDENNQLVYGDDLYGKDRRLLEGLRKTGLFSIPVKLK